MVCLTAGVVGCRGGHRPVPSRGLEVADLQESLGLYCLSGRGGGGRFSNCLRLSVNEHPKVTQGDHQMPLQQTIEVPRSGTEGAHRELEPYLSDLAGALSASGHDVRVMRHIGGGMNAIEIAPDGAMRGLPTGGPMAPWRHWAADARAPACASGPVAPRFRPPVSAPRIAAGHCPERWPLRLLPPWD